MFQYFFKKKLTKNTWETSDVADLEKYWIKVKNVCQI